MLVPCVLLAGLELALRLAGYGYPTAFFLRRQIQSRDMLVENSRFGLRFFPAAIARSPPPIAIPARKPPGTYRIFLFGESAALGDPRPAYGMSRYLEVLLRERFPEARFEVVCVAMTAINSHVVRLIAQECARHEGDLWIVYMGNNEMVGPFGAGTVFGPQAPSLAFIRASLALKTTRTGQWLDALHQRLRGGASDPAVWGGVKMFREHEVGPDDPRRATVRRHFERNLEDIVRYGLAAGCPVALGTVASNLRDCAPFASLHRADAAVGLRSDWDSSFQTGKAQEAGGRPEQALASYDKARQIDPQFAELQFRTGHCLRQLTNYGPARAAFEAARDCDALCLRTPADLNASIRQIADQYTNRPVVCVNAPEMLAGLAPDGIPGNESFFEHVHLTFEGNYRLARTFAEQIEPLLPASVTRRPSPEWASADLCNRRLALTDWNRAEVLEEVLGRIADAPFTNQITHAAQRQQLLARWADLRKRLRPDQHAEATAIYQEALARAPEDYRLHEAYAEFLEATGDGAGAAAQWQVMRDLLPHHFVAYVHLGRMQVALGRLREARDQLNEALRLEPRSPEARVELARIAAREGRWLQATAFYQEALHAQPGNARARMELADALAQLGKRADAVAELERAVRTNPGLWEARYLLGVELAMQEKVPEAQAQFEEVIRLQPNHVLARLNLGIALARLGRVNSARLEFEEVLRLDPHNPKAKQHLQTLESLTNDRGLP